MRKYATLAMGTISYRSKNNPNTNHNLIFITRIELGNGIYTLVLVFILIYLTTIISKL